MTDSSDGSISRLSGDAETYEGRFFAIPIGAPGAWTGFFVYKDGDAFAGGDVYDLGYQVL